MLSEDEHLSVGLSFVARARARFLLVLQSPHGAEARSYQRKLWLSTIEQYAAGKAEAQRRLEVNLQRVRGAHSSELSAARAVLDELDGGPVTLAFALRRREDPLQHWLLWRALDRRDELHRDLAETLHRWALRWNLVGAEWVLDAALQALELWTRDGEARRCRAWTFPEVEVVVGPQGSWNPVSGLTRRDAARLERGLVVPGVESESARSFGLQTTRFDDDAYVRLIRFQILGQTYRAIAQRPGGESRVREPVIRLAGLLGLPLRSARRSHPHRSCSYGARRTAR